MLTPAQITALRDAAGQIADPINSFLIEDIARRIAGAGQLTSTAAYEVWRAQQLGMSQREIKEQLRKLLKVSHRDLRKLLAQSAEVGYDFDVKHLPYVQARPFAQNAVVQQLVAAAVQLARDDFTNLTQTLGMVDPYGKALPLQDAYRSAIDYAFKQVFTGAADYNTAIRRATKNIADKGVQWIDYESGVHTSLETATRRNIMGGLGLMQEQIIQHNHDMLGANGWEISAHAASAQDHEPIQGRQYSDKEYQDLNDSLARRIGTLNCGHVAFPIIMGVSAPQYSRGQLAEMKRQNADGVTYQGRDYTMYEATQLQRKVERTIRMQKRRILVSEAAGDTDKLLTDRIRLVRLNDEYSRFSRAAGLPTQRERTEVAGGLFAKRNQKKSFDEQYVVSTENASQPKESPLQNPSNNGIISNTRRFSDLKQADQLFRPWTEDLWPKLTVEQREAAYRYTMDSDVFNCPLRGYDKSWDDSAFKGVGNVPLNNEGAGKWIEDLKAAINKAEIKDNVWLYRGSDQKALAHMLGIDQNKVIPSNISVLNRKFSGRIVTDHAFFSTGASSDMCFNDEDIIYEVLAPAGTKGIYAEPFSHLGLTNTDGTWDGKQKSDRVGSEVEVILQAGTEFTVLEIRLVDQKINVVLKIIK